MEEPHQQSRLDYARLHAASDSYATSRPRRLNETREISPKGLSRLTQNIRGAQASVDREIRDEKLGVQKECARLLSSIIQGTKTKGLEIDWDDYLPAFDCNDDLRLEGPLLRKAERETLVRSTRPLSDDGRKVGPVHEYVRRLGEGDPPDGVRQGVDNVMTKIKNEKLHCSKDSLVLIQKTMGSTGFSLWELHKLWDTVKVGEESEKPIYTPLVISTADHSLFRSLLPESQRSFSPVFDKADSWVSKDPRTEARVQSPQPATNGSAGPVQPSEQDYNMVEDVQNEIPPAKRSATVRPSLSCPSNDGHDGQDGQDGQDGHTSQAIERKGDSQTTVVDLISRDNSPCPESQAVDTLANNNAQPVHSPIATLCPVSASLHAPNTTDAATVTTGTRLKRRHIIQGHRTKRPKLYGEYALSTQTPTTSPFTSLGSLSTFMETRSRAKRYIAQSAYFSNKPSDISQVQKDYVPESRPVSQKLPNDHNAISSRLTTQFPQCSNNHTPTVLFLSTTLLKSHLRLVQSLERTEERPVIIYRDYDNNDRQATNPAISQPNQAIHPKEADIIISPTTGILLTTSQATTQRYLPGHRPHPLITSSSGHNNKNSSSSIKETINSPLREQIFLLAPRYEHIYVLITHTTPSRRPSNDPTHTHQPWAADEQILSNLASLAAFCASLAPHVTVQPLIIPSGTETVARWVLALAKKHAIALPGGGQGLDWAEQTCWEVFLRRVGLNPYAARALLGSLKGDVGRGGLSELLKLSEQNRRLLGGLIGERVLRRMEGILEKDWQCDWALDFGDNEN